MTVFSAGQREKKILHTAFKNIYMHALETQIYSVSALLTI